VAAVHTVGVESSAPSYIINYAADGMVFTRGSRDDWDRWAEIVEDDGLKWDNMMPYMLKVCLPFTQSSLLLNLKKKKQAEKLVRDSENQTEQGHIDPSLYGSDGKLFLTSEFRDHPINDMFLQVTEEIPEEFPFLLDMNDGRPIGICEQYDYHSHKYIN